MRLFTSNPDTVHSWTFRHVVTSYLGLNGCLSCDDRVNRSSVQTDTADCNTDYGRPEKEALSESRVPPATLYHSFRPARKIRI